MTQAAELLAQCHCPDRKTLRYWYIVDWFDGSLAQSPNIQEL